jgi:hypothetical protein
MYTPRPPVNVEAGWPHTLMRVFAKLIQLLSLQHRLNAIARYSGKLWDGVPALS